MEKENNPCACPVCGFDCGQVIVAGGSMEITCPVHGAQKVLDKGGVSY